MIPPLLRRCPDCGHVNWRRRFTVVAPVGDRPRVECPACGHQFVPVDDPRLA